MGTFGKNVKNGKELNKALVDYYKLGDINPQKPSEEDVDKLIDVSGDSMFNFGIDGK